MIDTPSGQVAIESIKVGDQVYSWDTDNHRLSLGIVLQTFEHDDKPVGVLELEDGTHFDVTPEHRFFIPAKNKWIQAGKLNVGDFVLQIKDGLEVQVAIKLVEFKVATKKADVFNFHVFPFMNYFANGVLVHNMKAP